MTDSSLICCENALLSAGGDTNPWVRLVTGSRLAQTTGSLLTVSCLKRLTSDGHDFIAQKKVIFTPSAVIVTKIHLIIRDDFVQASGPTEKCDNTYLAIELSGSQCFLPLVHIAIEDILLCLAAHVVNNDFLID